MTQTLRSHAGSMFAVVRVLLTLMLLGMALIDGHKWI